MKTLYLTDSSANIALDPETNTVCSIPTEDRYDIRNIYYAEEPMHVVYNSGECHEEADVKKGEIILLFYNNSANKYHLDTIRSKQWAANIKNRRAIEQKEKEEWAARNANILSDPVAECKSCCDVCCNKCECVNSANTAEKAAEKVKKAVKKSKKA